MSDKPVVVTRVGAVTVVSLNRQQARNAVDGATAQALADAFRAFDADASSSVAVLHGEHATFCAGADLKAMNDPARRNRLEPEGDAPMGPSRMLLSKPVVAAISGHAVAGDWLNMQANKMLPDQIEQARRVADDWLRKIKK